MMDSEKENPQGIKGVNHDSLDEFSRLLGDADDNAFRSLLQKWQAAKASPAMDHRIMSAFRAELHGEEITNEAALAGNGSKRFVGEKMKQCTTCQEEFADKFSFCPVDGTPLNHRGCRIGEPVSGSDKGGCARVGTDMAGIQTRPGGIHSPSCQRVFGGVWQVFEEAERCGGDNLGGVCGGQRTGCDSSDRPDAFAPHAAADSQTAG